GRNGIAQQRDRLISAGKPLRHDAGADHRGDQNAGTDRLGKQTAADHAADPFNLPIESSCRCSESLSSERKGRLTKTEMRFDSMRNVSANAKRTCASSPVAAAGSGTPQCAVIGCPGQNGQVSPAALSQTVKTKSSGVAPGPLNLFQLLERNPPTSKSSLRRRSSVYGCTCPLGWLPAENARKLPRPSRF